MQTTPHDPPTTTAHTGTPVPLGHTLRPIVFGGGTRTPNVFASDSERPPELVLGVHGLSGRLVGYIAIDQTRPGGTWGGMTISHELSLADALVLASRTAVALQLFGIPRSAHHCLIVVEPKAGTRERRAQAREYVDALRPIVKAGMCTIVYTNDGGQWSRSSPGRPWRLHFVQRLSRRSSIWTSIGRARRSPPTGRRS